MYKVHNADTCVCTHRDLFVLLVFLVSYTRLVSLTIKFLP